MSSHDVFITLSPARLARKTWSWSTIPCALLIILAAPAAASASALAYEAFDYPIGSTLPGLNGPFGWGAPWIGSVQMVTLPPDLQYPLALPSTGIALLNPAPGEAWRPFVAAFDNLGSELWISFMEMSLVAGSGAFVSLDPPTPAFPTIFVNKAGPTGAVQLGPGGVPNPAGFSAGVGSVDFFVIRVSQFSGGSSTVDLFLDPANTLFAVPSASFTVATPVAIARFYYRSDPGQVLDEIRVGTSPADVAAASHAGDMNCDGLVNFDDINPFVLALSDPAGYQAAYPNCNWLNADCNGDGSVNFDDIDAFVALLSGSP